MSDTDDALSPKAAKVGGVLILIGVVLSLILQTQLVPSSVRDNSTFLLFVAQGLACVSGFMVLISNIKKATRTVRYGTIAVAGLIMLFLLGCFALAMVGNSDTVRALGQEFGVVVSGVLFFLFAAGVDDLLSAVKKWQHGLAVLGWLGNIVAMVFSVLMWTHGHLQESDNILTAAFLVSYVALSSTKYISLCLTSSHGSRKVQGILAVFVVVPVLLGWLYIVALTRPDLLPGWVLNASLFAAATEFGASYGIDSVLRGRTEVPRVEFLVSIGLQAVFMAGVGIIGAFLPSGAPLVIGLLCMETLPNLPGGGVSFVSELFRKKPQSITRWYRPGGVLFWYSAAFGVVVCALIVLCSLAVYFQQYAIIGGGITICVLQAIPWMRVAQRSCMEWAERPGRALFTLITVLIAAGAVCVFLAVTAAKGEYKEADLVAIWYSVARIPTAVSLGCFGLLGVGLLGHRAPRAWRYLLIASTGAVFVGFAWFIPALFTGSVGAMVAPGLLMQVAGGVIVTLVYPAFNSSSFRAMADAELATKPAAWGNPPASSRQPVISRLLLRFVNLVKRGGKKPER